MMLGSYRESVIMPHSSGKKILRYVNVFLSFFLSTAKHCEHDPCVLTEYQLDQLVEVAHKDCCWGAPHSSRSYRINAPK